MTRHWDYFSWRSGKPGEDTVFVTDKNGYVIRLLMKLSDFQERPKFYLSKQESLAQD
jgi:hypothetical protein